MAAQVLFIALTVISARQLIEGNSISRTVTVKLQVAVAPFAAVTVNVFIVIPMGKTAPEARPPVRVVFAPGQLSVPTGGV